jgi:light-regulated signal transduction histidine kinase (bacteriophytochrome)
LEDLSLHILDIAENSIAADATRIEIKVIEDVKNDLLTIEIADNGRGMDEDAVKRVLDPFFTTRKTRRVGLGLPLLAQAARESGGDIEIESAPHSGTRVKATFGYSHIDRKPLGDLEGTLMALIAGNPRIDFLYEHQKGDETIHLDTRELKASETER